MKGLIISSGHINDIQVILSASKDRDFILCADGGIRYAMKANLIPHAIIGDLDSTNDLELKFIEENKIPIIKYPVEKDYTDSELAIDYLIQKGAKDIVLIGVTGSRMDHTIGNILLLKKLYLCNVKGKIIDDNNTIYYSEGYLKLERVEDHYVSIIPLNTDGVIVSLKGFYYPLEDKHISYGSTLGISNKIIEEYGEIFIKRGEALIILSCD